jgi:hypothetical protein
MQNKKIDEYLANIRDEQLYGNEKYFKKYYINTIIYLMKTLYIDISDISPENTDTGDESNITHRIPCIYMITDEKDVYYDI